MNQALLDYDAKERAKPKIPGGRQGRVYRLLLDGNYTRENPLNPLDLDRYTYGLDPSRYIRFFREDAAKFGMRLCEEARENKGNKRYLVYWVEAR